MREKSGEDAASRISKDHRDTCGWWSYQQERTGRSIFADGADSTRVIFRVTDEFGNIRPFANDAVRFDLEGPGEIIGDNPFPLVGGTGAIWIRARQTTGGDRDRCSTS